MRFIQSRLPTELYEWLRLRFRVLTPEKRRDLLSVIGELVTRDFQLRHTGGNRAWSATNRP